MVSIYDTPAVEDLRRQLRCDPQLLRRLRTDFFKKSTGAEAALAELPSGLRHQVAGRVRFHDLVLVDRYDSSHDGATKLVFRTRRGFLIESVLLRSGTGRTTLCVSCQIGCAAHCSFCATGKMGIAHNLTATEILDQVVQAAEVLAREDRRIRNIVFMGMGEPFHNEAAVYDAVAALLDPQLFHYPPGRLLISTVGIPDAMMRAARRFPAVNQALSLHSVRQRTRLRLIPLAAKYSLEELREALVCVNRLQRTTVMIEYLLLAGENDSEHDAHQLIAWLDGLRVHVNLIPYNPIDDAPQLVATDRVERDAFARMLKAAGLTTTIRYSLGADIAAACGQLLQRENRQLAQELAGNVAAASQSLEMVSKPNR